MSRDPRFTRARQKIALAGGGIVALLAATPPAAAQSLDDLQQPESPLVLAAQGSFFVGGEPVERTHVQLGSFGPGGHVSVGQMYVRYMLPYDPDVPVVLVHGMALTGKSWETTPDGRMGWDEHFVRKGHPVYVPDQVGRGRSGFDQAVFNDVRAGVVPPSEQPPIRRFSDEVVWPNFRFGSSPGAPYGDTRFPVEAVDELSKQGVPDLGSGVPTPSPTPRALSVLGAELGGAVLVGHSQAGSFPLEAALLDPESARGLVLIEPGRCPTSSTDEQIGTLAAIPILVVFGDHRDTPTGIAGFGDEHFWQLSFEGCQDFVARINAAGGRAEMLDLAERGLRGNSHMLMQDENHLEIADLITTWIDTHVGDEQAADR